MSLLDYLDSGLAFLQGLFAILLWHRAEPRMRQARGTWQAMCTLALGFVLASSFPLALSRSLDHTDPLHWQWTFRDALLVLYAACLYRHAMTVKAKGA